MIFVDTDTAVREYPDLVKKYFGTVVSPEDNKFGALNTAAWSGGSFVYVPKGVHVDIPLQAYFRINTPAMGQFERTLIIADEGSYVHYVEGCTRPDLVRGLAARRHRRDHRREACARARYTTVQNWSNNVYNLVTQRAYVREGGTMEWVEHGNIGSKATMKYPACILAEPHAKAETMSLGFAGKGQYSGHRREDDSSRSAHQLHDRRQVDLARRWPLRVPRNWSRSSTEPKARRTPPCATPCWSTTSAVPTRTRIVDVREDDVTMAHEATVSKVSEDQLFYLMSRGLEEKEAMGMIVRGFVEPISRELPMEYALELNRLVELQMEGSVG